MSSFTHRGQVDFNRLKQLNNLGFLTEVASKLWEEIDSPFSLSLYIRWNNGGVEGQKEVLSVTLDPARYLSDKEFADDLQALDFLRKIEADHPASPRSSRKEDALKKALDAEERCKEFNEKLATDVHLSQTFNGLCLRDVLHVAAEKIEWILGDFSLEEFLSSCSFGPGVSDTVKGPFVAPYNKFSGKPSFTVGAADIAALFMEQSPLWREAIGINASGAFCPLGCIALGNVVTTVPKTVLIDRSIRIEPNWNIFFQKGIGLMIRRRLKRVGIDLNDQFPNACLAAFGSLTGKVFTIDLSSASDLQCKRLVELLYNRTWNAFACGGGYPKPSAWYRMLMSTRCDISIWPDGPRLNHQFSSMGNGFTFELESLTFYAIAAAVLQLRGISATDLRVYGDDITGPSEAFCDISWCLEQCGFVVNPRKSFNATPFRESCGGNFFYGHDVTPVRCTTLDNISSFYALINGLGARGYWRTKKFVLDKLRALRLVFYGPQCLGDVCVHTPHFHLWTCKGFHGRDLGWNFWAYRLLVPRFIPFKGKMRTYAPAVIHSLFTTGPENSSRGLFDLRGRGKWTVGEILVDKDRAELWSPL